MFLEPIMLPYAATSADDHELVRELADELREKMQDALNEELKARDSVYL